MSSDKKPTDTSAELLSLVHQYLIEEGLENVAKSLKTEAGKKVTKTSGNLKECFELYRKKAPKPVENPVSTSSSSNSSDTENSESSSSDSDSSDEKEKLKEEVAKSESSSSSSDSSDDEPMEDAKKQSQQAPAQTPVKRRKKNPRNKLQSQNHPAPVVTQVLIPVMMNLWKMPKK
ncbi:hypothetical protein DSO57_1037480 [Entomophthora muscae]|uniref:Uncharacterized protein n=1 Tax=Entomophthora muscae TaxID=34485 RepID=A0ACC2RDM5_9FUNG|nr:hypothetical protein DSO57_1037480 [Entomophthora muscae]